MDKLQSHTIFDKIKAWSVHLFTSMGAVCAYFALIAGVEKQWQESFIWMGIAVFVDSVDGTFARKFHVKDVLPKFDGSLLDNIIDYLTYTFIPAYLVYVGNLVTGIWTFIAPASILLSSCYQFCQADAKTDDHFFKGFPSYWNILVMYLFLIQGDPFWNAISIVLCAILVFVPIKYIYPSRTKAFMVLTLVLTALWGVAVLFLLIYFNNPPGWLLWSSLAYPVYYVLISLWLNKK